MVIVQGVCIGVLYGVLFYFTNKAIKKRQRGE